MMPCRDLFGVDTSLASGEEIVEGMVQDWFGTLLYCHNSSTHREILESLDWPGMPAFIQAAMVEIAGVEGDFDAFAVEVRRLAQRARDEGLVVPDGKPRRRTNIRQVCLDFVGEE